MPGLKVILIILVKGSPDISRSGHQGSVVHCCIRIIFSEAPLRIQGCQSYNMLQPPIKNIHLRLFNEMHICFLIVVGSQDNIRGIAHIHHWDVDHLLHRLGFIHMLYIYIIYIYNCWKKNLTSFVQLWFHGCNYYTNRQAVCISLKHIFNDSQTA